MAPNATTYAVRFGCVIAAVALFVLVVAPGSRADDAVNPHELAVPREAGGVEAAAQAPTTTVPTTLPIAPTTLAPPSTVAPPTSAPAPTTVAKPAAPTTARRLTVFDIVGVPIDRGATWIAIATVTIIDQSGSPVANVDVTGTWSVGPTPTSCRTDTSGKCSMYQSPLPADVASTTIAITAPEVVSRPIFRVGN